MNPFQDIFHAQKVLFASGVTRTYDWRVDQLDRVARMIKENEPRFQEAMAKDFKTASQEYIFETQASAGETEVQKSQLKEWMKPVEAPVPRFLAETGHKGTTRLSVARRRSSRRRFRRPIRPPATPLRPTPLPVMLILTITSSISSTR
jgi:hypothetical protein